jgi:hypothetical protein
MSRILEAFARFWQFLRDVVTVLRPCRFSALVVVAGALLLLSAQGLEFTVRLPSEPFAKAVWFDLCVFLWAFQSWYWARLALDLTFGRDRNAALDHPRADSLKRIIVQTPRVLAAGSYLVALAACLLAGKSVWLSLALAVEGILFYVFLVLRTRLVGAPGSGWRRSLFAWKEGSPGSLRSLPQLSLIILGATLLCAAALTVWVCRDAVGFGWTFGSAAVPFLGFAMLVPVGSLLVLWARDGGRKRLGAAPGPADTRGGYPVITLLVLLAVAFSFFPSLDNHQVRAFAPAEPAGAPVALDPFLDRWRARAPRSPDGRTNFVVVATAGGGLRAGFWTVTVLGAIQDEAPEFRRQLVGISGVSGGSLGAAVFATLAGQSPMSDSVVNCSATAQSVGRYQCAGQAVLSQDFLAPAVAALLFPDLMQRFAPFGFPDRAGALEESWERAWGKAGFPEDFWSGRGFRALWAGDHPVPALLLNGTHVETGKRIIVSNLDIAGSPGVFRDVYDFYRLLPSGLEIRPSTAAHNSARFTYVSPAGTLSDGTHVVDGGYFENFGAVTARELVEAGVERWGGEIRPVVILISNDPELGERDLPAAAPQPPRGAKPQTVAGEALSPIRALLHTRNARGLLAASQLRAFAEQNDGKYFQFRLCKEPGHPDPALGWVLSDESEELMRKQLVSARCGNAEQLKSLLEVLRSG